MGLEGVHPPLRGTQAKIFLPRRFVPETLRPCQRRRYFPNVSLRRTVHLKSQFRTRGNSGASPCVPPPKEGGGPLHNRAKCRNFLESKIVISDVVFFETKRLKLTLSFSGTKRRGPLHNRGKGRGSWPLSPLPVLKENSR